MKKNPSKRRRICICLVLIIVLASLTGNAFAVMEIPPPSQTVTLHIFKFWDGKDRVPVIYDPNGGTGTVVVVPVTKGGSHKVVDQGYTEADCDFTWWSAKADGSGTRYKNGETISNITTQTVLYAQYGRVITGRYVYLVPNLIPDKWAFNENEYEKIPGVVVEKGIVFAVRENYGNVPDELREVVDNRKSPPDTQISSPEKYSLVFKEQAQGNFNPFGLLLNEIESGDVIHYAAYVINNDGEVFYGEIETYNTMPVITHMFPYDLKHNNVAYKLYKGELL